MRRIFKRRFSMTETVGFLIFIVIGVTIYADAATTVPHTFTAGSTAKASEVNANFQALATAIDTISPTPGPTGATGATGATGPQGPAGSPDTADQVRGKFFSGTSCTDPNNNPNDIMVKVGPICIDKYEASVWPNFDGTGTQRGATADDYGAGFPDNGNWTTPLYAVSKAGVIPSRFITWFQAQQACALSGKRLLTNAEWQMAAAGTPDPGAGGNGTTTCNTSIGGPVGTGSTGNCVSNWGVHDMVGNVWEWVADWMPLSTACPGWGAFSDDLMCLSGASTTLTTPAALVRGGSWGSGTVAGVFALFADDGPSGSTPALGFRCAR